MTVSIARGQPDQDRLFPPIISDPFLQEGKNASFMLRKADSVLSRRLRLGNHLIPGERVARLFWLHRAWLRAELDGQNERADFWQEERDAEWARLPPDHSEWAEAAASENGLISGSQLRDRVALELIADSHVALSNGGAARSKLHLDCARQYIADTGVAALSDFDRQCLLSLINEASEGLDIQKAIELAEGSGDSNLLLRIRVDAINFYREQHDWDRALVELKRLPGGYNLVPNLLEEAVAVLQSRAEYREAAQFAEQLSLVGADAPRWKSHARILCDAAREDSKFRIREYCAQSKWDMAIELARNNLEDLGSGWRDKQRFAELHVEAAQAVMESGKAGAEHHYATWTTKINRYSDALANWVRQNPDCFPAYRALATIHLLRAACLANGRRPADALLAVAHARAMFPTKAADQLDAQVRELIGSLHDAVAKLRSDIQTQFGFIPDDTALGLVLDKDTPGLLEQARLGTSPADEYMKSNEANAAVEAVKQAQSRWMWIMVGAPVPKSHWDEQAQELAHAVEKLLSGNFKNEADLIASWSDISRNSPRLSQITAQQVLSALSYEDPPAEKPVVTELAPPAVEIDQLLTPEAPPPERMPPRLVAKSTRNSVSRIPLEFWLFRRYDLAAKVAVVISILFVACSLWATAGEASKRKRRDWAYDRLTQAVGVSDPNLVKAALDDYSSCPQPLFTTDHRISQIQLFGIEVMRWEAALHRASLLSNLSSACLAKDVTKAMQSADQFLAAFPTDDDAVAAVKALRTEIADHKNRQIRDRAYDTLAVGVKNLDGPATTAASAEFLAAAPTTADERRANQVREIRSAASYFTDRVSRDAAYSRLMEACRRRTPALAIESARAFMAALPSGVTDDRAETVREALASAPGWAARSARDAAYERLAAATRRLDDKAAVQAAADFTAAMPAGLDDQRAEQVANITRKARSWPARRHRDDAYLRLEQAVANSNDEATLEACEQFLNHVDSSQLDSRIGQVRSIYRGTFGRWFARQPSAAPATKARADVYAKHASSEKGNAQ